MSHCSQAAGEGTPHLETRAQVFMIGMCSMMKVARMQDDCIWASVSESGWDNSLAHAGRHITGNMGIFNPKCTQQVETTSL